MLKDTGILEGSDEHLFLQQWLQGRVADDAQLERLRFGTFTSFNESFHAICNKYCPKHDYVEHAEYCRRKSLARLHWNEIRENGVPLSKVPVFRFQREIIRDMIALM